MPTSKLSAVDAQTGSKISLATFDDANGNTVVGHIALAGSALAPVSASNPMPVADGALATAIATLSTELAGVATSTGQASALTTLGNILSKLDAVGISGTVAVQDAAAEASLAALATISSNTSGLAMAAGAPADMVWDGTSGGSLVAIGKAIVAAVQSVAAKLGAKLSVQQTDPLPTGANTIGAVNVNGTVAVQDSAVAASLGTAVQSLAAIATNTGAEATAANQGAANTTLAGILAALDAKLSVRQTDPLPAGTNALGTVGVTGTVAVQDGAAAASLGAIATTLAGTVSVQQGGPLPAGTNTIGGVSACNGVTLTQTVVSLAAGSDAQLLGVNPNRKSCGFFLTTAGAVGYLNVGAVATSANGLPFGQGSQFGYAYTWEGSGVPTNGLHMMSPANATVVVWEGV